MFSRDLLTTRDVSNLLGVEARQVRALAEAGVIVRVARGVFDRGSVERYRLERGSGRTRTWAENTAWTAVAMLAGVAVDGFGEAQAYRLRATLRGTSDPTDLVVRLRERARVTRWSAHRSALERVRGELVVPGRRLGLVVDDTVVDGYLAVEKVAGLVRRLRLVEDSGGNVTLRATGVGMDRVSYLAAVDTTLAAVDAATSLDPRERGVGERVLASRLQRFRSDATT